MPPTRLWRIFRTIVVVLAAIAALLVLAAAAYEEVASRADRRSVERLGHSVDIGGRSLNIHCSGKGAPTVIFESGRTSPGYVWMPSQRGVSQVTRACWYDRAGLGWSDPGPDPNWADSAARDLDAVLTAAGVRPPLVMVGHSFGGYIVRIYHDTHPGNVVGMVLVDAAHEDAGTITGMPYRAPPPLPRWAIRGLSIVLGRLGMMRAMARDPGPPPKDWSSEEWATLARLRRQRGAALADASEGPERESSDRVRTAGGLEHLPLIVLTQGKMPRGGDAQANESRRRFLNAWIALQKGWVDRSSGGRQIVVANSGHGIPLEAPSAVIDAVRQLVEDIRRQD